MLNAGFQQLKADKEKADIIFWEINDIAKTLKELRYNVQYKHIIVDIQTDQISHFLDVAARMSILSSYHHYMFTSLVSIRRIFRHYRWPFYSRYLIVANPVYADVM